MADGMRFVKQVASTAYASGRVPAGTTNDPRHEPLRATGIRTETGIDAVTIT